MKLLHSINEQSECHVIDDCLKAHKMMPQQRFMAVLWVSMYTVFSLYKGLHKNPKA